MKTSTGYTNVNSTQYWETTAFNAEREYLSSINTDKEFDKLDAFDQALTAFLVPHIMTSGFSTLHEIDAERVILELMRIMTFDDYEYLGLEGYDREEMSFVIASLVSEHPSLQSVVEHALCDFAEEKYINETIIALSLHMHTD